MKEKCKQVVKTKGENFREVQYKQVTNWGDWQQGIVVFTFNFPAQFIPLLKGQKNSF